MPPAECEGEKRLESLTARADVPAIDAHVHLDRYPADERRRLLADGPAAGVRAWISVSFDLASCRQTEALAQAHPGRVFAAYGHHPEQALPDGAGREALLVWLERRRGAMIALGEVGLPYYARCEARRRGEGFDLEPYVEWLEVCVRLAAAWEKPIVLHAVYDDAPVAVALLERHNVRAAHFHWFKGDAATLERMRANGYHVSFTPDVVYESETRSVALAYPVELMMIETDGPWPYEGPFAGQPTHPRLLRPTLAALAELKRLPPREFAALVLANTVRFYRLPPAEG
ncbi:MAG TPA: TatD family hydrolase [Limnochordia bacterium]|nr:TatD family hydrolase [Limnochordia bacterium]